MKYRIILKSGASFELDLDDDCAREISNNMLVKNNHSAQTNLNDGDDVFYASIIVSEVVVIYRLEVL